MLTTIVITLNVHAEVKFVSWMVNTPCAISKVLHKVLVLDLLIHRYEKQLTYLSGINLIFKYADDTTFIVAENTAVKLTDEYNHIKNWAIINKMCINEIRTKELAFHRPC